MDVVLPRSTVALIGKVPLSDRHPGLQLDKYSVGGEQTQQREALNKVCQVPGDKQFFAALLPRRAKMLAALPGTRQIVCITVGPLTLHLSRASALENAGICQHPLYGFVYLPGSGLKGMARAYAETVAGATSDEIQEVFGNEPGEPKKEKQRAGAVIFHDAWPEEWPQLVVDIVNNHHPDYYQARPDDNTRPPGDWENPNPVYFLAVPSGAKFRFALSPRRADVGKEVLERAKDWLVGALCHLGAGAKTAAGYGSFRPIQEPPLPLPSPARVSFEATLALVTPAFLAGASQQKADCDLRSATLRGLLRWWWRTMHAGYVDIATLRRLEATVWGDTDVGGPIRATLEPTASIQPVLYDYRDRRQRFRVEPRFAREHQLQDPPPNGQTTQGLFYASYGMNDGGRQRWYKPPGTSWKVTLTARSSCYEERNRQGKVLDRKILSAECVLQQARSALWLLCHLGGIGSKARKGFGSFADISGSTLEECQQAAAAFRRDDCGLTGPFQPEWAQSPSVEETVSQTGQTHPWLELVTPWRDPWFALDQVGFAAEGFAQSLAHDAEKLALGLPRQIDGPRRQPLNHQDPARHRSPRPLRGPEGDRHASPVFYHLAQTADGNLVIRVTAFVARKLPDAVTSRRVLKKLLQHLQNDFVERIQLRDSPAPSATGSSSTPALVPGTASSRRPPGTPVTVTIVAEHPNLGAGAFFVQEAGKPRGVLSPKKAPNPLPGLGSSCTVYIVSDDPRSPQYRWDKPEELTQQGRDRGRPGRGGPPRGRR